MINEINDKMLDEIYDLSKKKKKQKKNIEFKMDTEKESELYKKHVNIDNNDENKIYNYYYLLNRLYQIMSYKKDFKKNVIRVKCPVVVKISIRKISWTNFVDVCDSINRKTNYLFKYTLNELNATGLINENNHFIITPFNISNADYL
jgi:translation initiation factor 2 beta subunit (eIF-2beta)/eIF-5